MITEKAREDPLAAPLSQAGRTLPISLTNLGKIRKALNPEYFAQKTLRKVKGSFEGRQNDCDTLIFTDFLLILSDYGNDIFQQIKIEAVEIWK